jgi:hypothetical protein
MMTNLHVAQLSGAVLAAATPWMVVQIAQAVARPPAASMGVTIPRSRSAVFLARATILAVLAVATLAVLLPAPSAWMGVIDLIAFAGLSAIALRALSDLDRATEAARRLDAETREASLVVRRHEQYLPWSWRLAMFGVATAGFALFAWRATVPSAVDRRLFVPMGFAAVAAVFLWLYEVWIHTLVKGPAVVGSVDPNDSRRQWIRIVFAAESILVISFLALAHALLDMDWRSEGPRAAVMAMTGGVLGVIGCSLALSSDLITRQYRIVR